MIEAHTLDQLPKTAADYYSGSIRSGLFGFDLVGTDDAGRRVYQWTIDGEAYGAPRALMTYREYAAKVKDWAALCRSIGVGRWTDPYCRNGELWTSRRRSGSCDDQHVEV